MNLNEYLYESEAEAMTTPIDAALLKQYPMLMFDETGNSKTVDDLSRFMNIEMSGSTNAATGGAGSGAVAFPTSPANGGLFGMSRNATLGIIAVGFLLLLTAGKK